MDKVNRAIQGTNDLEQMMSKVLETVLAIFAGDRAWLLYPCDPQAATWSVPMEHVSPMYPGALALGLGETPMDPETAEVVQIVRAASGPVRFGRRSIRLLRWRGFSIQSIIAVAPIPRGPVLPRTAPVSSAV
jgi:hypothetical protein